MTVYDAKLTLGGLSIKLRQQLAALAPFGSGTFAPMLGLLVSGGAAWSPTTVQSGARQAAVRGAAVRMQDLPFPLPYEVPPLPKPFSDYEWDPTYPGTMKPGLRLENQELDDVLEMWKDKENGNVMELPRDQLWQVPLKPPEDILTWLARIGLLDESEDGDDSTRADSSLLDDEFDLDGSDVAEEGMFQDPDTDGATMSDTL